MQNINLKSIIIILSAAGVFMTSCSSGQTAPDTQATAPVGPVSYQYIQDSYAVAAGDNVKNKSTNSIANPTCGLAASGVGAVTGMFAFLPIVGTAFGSISALENYVGAGNGSSCVAQQLNTINQNLNYQESQIQSLQVGVSYFANQFAQDNYTSATAIAGLAQLTYNDSITYFIGNGDGQSGLFANTMIDLNFWSPSRQPYQINDSEIGMVQVYKLNPDPSSQTQFQQNLSNFAGIGYHDSCTIDCYTTTNRNSSSALILTLSDLYNQANANIATYMSTSNQSDENVVSIIDNYNTTVNGIYVQAVNALQQAYAMEYLVNFVNYNALNNQYFALGNMTPSLGDILQSSSYGQVPGTLFNYIDLYNSLGGYPTESQIVNSYNSAQEQLALMYASAANEMYQTFVSYTLSDNLIGSQQFPTNNTITHTFPNGLTKTYTNNIDYAALINNGININNSTTLSRPIGMLGLSSLNIQNLSNTNYLIYQSGVNNVNQCLASLDSYNVSVSSPNFINFASSSQFNCNSIYNSANGFVGNYLPAQQLELYYANSSSMAPAPLVSPDFYNLANTTTEFSGGIYNISAYALSVMNYNNNSYLFTNLYNQSSTDAYNVYVNSIYVDGWSQIGSTQSVIDASTDGNLWYYAYIPFDPVVYGNGYLPTYLLAAATTSSQDPAAKTAGQLGYFNYTSTPTSPNLYFNPMGSGGGFSPITGYSSSIIYYTLPDGTPMELAILLNPTGDNKNIADPITGNAQLAYNTGNYPSITCTVGGQCTTPFGNTFQINFTVDNSSGSSEVYLSATPSTN